MKVLDHFRPGPGRLALLLACPGRKCVVTLEGHRGRPPKEVDCPTHEKPRHRNGAARVGAGPDEGRPGRAGNRELPAGENDPRPSAPRLPSTVVEKQEDPTSCVNCGRPRKLAARGLCWSCYHSRRERAGERKAEPAASTERPAKAPRRPRRASGERPATPQAAPAVSDAGAGWRRVRDAELTEEAVAGVRKAIRALATTPRTSHLDPLEWERAVEEVLRAAQAAGWLDGDGDAYPHRGINDRAAERERERERG